MRGMDAGPGTDLGGLGWYVGIWVTMMAALMVILFALGVMSLFWMALIGALIFVQKVLPFGFRLVRPLALVFVAFGIWIAVSPGTVPGLTQPGASAHEHSM